jgi:hypothetical protein
MRANGLPESVDLGNTALCPGMPKNEEQSCRATP